MSLVSVWRAGFLCGPAYHLDNKATKDNNCSNCENPCCEQTSISKLLISRKINLFWYHRNCEIQSSTIYCDPTFTYTNTRIDVIISACQSLSINTHHWPDLFRALDFALYLYLCYLYNFIFESEFTRSLYILAINFGYIFAAYIKTVHSDRTFRPHIRTEHIRITQIHTNSSRKLFDSFRFYNYTVPPISVCQ